MKLKISIAALILILIMGIMGMTACTTSSIPLTDEEQTATDIYSAVKGFAIYLADSGELLLSENEIKTYHSDNRTLEMNENGINPNHIGKEVLMSIDDVVINIGINKAAKNGKTIPNINEKSIDIEFNLRPKISKL